MKKDLKSSEIALVVLVLQATTTSAGAQTLYDEKPPDRTETKTYDWSKSTNNPRTTVYKGGNLQSAGGHAVIEKSALEAVPQSSAGVNNAQARTAAPLSKEQQLEAYLQRQKAAEKARLGTYYEERAQNSLAVGQRKSEQIRSNIPYAPQAQVWSRDTDNTYIPLSERIPGYVPYSIREGMRGGDIGAGTVQPYGNSAATSPLIEAARLREAEAAEKAAEYRNISRQKQDGIDKAYDNFKTQLKDSKAADAAKLQSAGSNLYVRNYAKPGK